MFLSEPTITLLSRPSFSEPAHLPVQWMGEASDGERLAEFAGRLCYMSQRNPAQRTTADYLENIKRQGHGSVLEHANYSVLLEGVSRSLTHELVRHRAGFAYCLDGDTIVYSERRWGNQRNGAKKRTLRQLFEMSRTAHGRSRLKLVRLRCLDETTGAFTTGAVRSVVSSGVKPVFEVELDDGKRIISTKEHRFLTPGGWRTLEEIVGGLTISAGGLAVVGALSGTILTNGKDAYRDRSWLRARYHDDALMQSEIAEMAGVSEHCIRAWVRRHGLQKPRGSGMTGRTPWNKEKRYAAGWHHTVEARATFARQKRGTGNPQWKGGPLTLHHILPIWARPDLYRSIDNLATVCWKPCHTTLNGRELDYLERFSRSLAEISPGTLQPRGRGRLMVPRTATVTRVTYVGERETFDLEMAGPNHNFVANGIVTHNSQLSQRYVDESDARFVLPPAIIGDEELEHAWREQMAAALKSYVSLVEQLMEHYQWVGDKVHRRKMAREAARGVLPNSTETKILATANVRAWRTMLELRASEGAELEIRRLAVQLIRLFQTEAPAFFSDFEIYTAADRREAGRVGYHKV